MKGSSYLIALIVVLSFGLGHVLLAAEPVWLTSYLNGGWRFKLENEGTNIFQTDAPKTAITTVIVHSGGLPPGQFLHGVKLQGLQPVNLKLTVNTLK